MRIPNTFLAPIFVLFALPASAELVFTGAHEAAVTVIPEASTGLEAVYVVSSTSGVSISYTSTGGNVTWSRYDNRGGGFAEPVSGVSQSGNTYTIAASADDMGYVIDDGDRRHCFWVVNYANHQLQLDELTVSDESDCSRTALNVLGQGAPITYYTVNGRGVELSRELKLDYRTLVYDEGSSLWQESSKTDVLPSVKGHLYVDAPLCSTDFTLSGDRFLEAWGRGEHVQSEVLAARAVSAVTSATQEEHDADNESKPETGGLGGSAPCVVTFKAVPTDAAVFREWQFSSMETFDDVQNRFQQDELTYTFDKEGTTYVRYVCGNDDGECFYIGDVYTISIGASKLVCPNAFSPANEDGVNDEWKVSFTSIVSFECHIFNRWGTKIATLTNPSQGWDGRYKGKFVPSGVYFYVIKAKGADGKEYNLSGDINILNSRRNPDLGGSATE